MNLGIQHDPLYACCRYFPLLCCYPWNIGHQCIRKVVQLSERPTTAAMDVRVNLGIQHTHCMRVANISRYCVVIFATLATSAFAKLSCTAIRMPPNCCNGCNSESGNSPQPVVCVLLIFSAIVLLSLQGNSTQPVVCVWLIFPLQYSSTKVF